MFQELIQRLEILTINHWFTFIQQTKKQLQIEQVSFVFHNLHIT
jgi:hypothetical protein